VAIGYNSLTGPRITLEHIDRKILGMPATLSNKLQWGKLVQAWDVSLVTHPAESFHSWIAGASVSSITTTNDLVRAGSVRFGRTQNSNALDRMTYAQVERSIQCTPKDYFIGPLAGKNQDRTQGYLYDCVDARAVSLNQANVWRNVDSVILPTDGYTLSAQLGVGVAGSPGHKYSPYTRLYGRVTEYWPLPSSFYLQGRLELGQIVVADGTAMPDAEQWRAGGEDSVRGYAWRSLAPETKNKIVGGNSLVTGSIEIAHPFTSRLPSVWWAAFVDAGTAAARLNALEVPVGYGLGLRWRSPVGPLKIDWSWGEKIHRGRLDLSVGVAF
jgi:translocation and assembly module TamA